jgi:hypothetical protein
MSTQEQLESYYNLIEEDLEEITKEWLEDLLVSADPIEMSNIDSPKTTQDTPGLSKTKKEKMTKKTEEVQDVDNLSIRTTSITLDEEGDYEKGTEMNNRKLKYHCPGTKKTHQRKGRSHL